MPSNSQNVTLWRRATKIEELRRDFPLFFEQQLAIRPPVGPVIHAPLKYTQKLVDDVIEAQMKEKGWVRVVEFKSRQHGGSTHGVGRGCHRAFLNENVSALIVAQDDSTTANLFNMAQLFYESMDEDIRPVRRYLNKQAIVLENPDDKSRPKYPGLRSRLEIQSAKNVHAAVGTTRNWLHLSELARFGRIHDLKGSIIPAIHLVPGTAIIVESAPFGYGEGRDEFRAMCDAARSGKSPYHFVGVYWWMDTQCYLPLTKGQKLKRTTEEKRLVDYIAKIAKKELGREFHLTDEQLNYRRVRIQELGNGDDVIGEQLFQQQYAHDYESGWVSVELGVWPSYKLEKMSQSGMIRNPPLMGDVLNGEFVLMRGNQQGPVWIWELPQPGEIYDIGVDVASGGRGGDYSAFHIIKRSNKEQVAEYQEWISPIDYAKFLNVVGHYYNTAQIGVEMEGIGFATNEALIQLGYPYLYQWRQRQQMFVKLSNYSGWKTQQDTKKLLITTGDDLIINAWQFDHQEFAGYAGIHSTRLLTEMRKFIRDFTDMGHEVYYASEGNDDLQMAWLIGQQISRDEDQLSLPPDVGTRSADPRTLDERNERFQEALKRSQLGINDTPIHHESDDDPWSRLAKSMKGSA